MKINAITLAEAKARRVVRDAAAMARLVMKAARMRPTAKIADKSRPWSLKYPQGLESDRTKEVYSKACGTIVKAIAIVKKASQRAIA
jgi:hypothetical protein